MARARNIKPGFFKNEELAELQPECRLLFIGLWTLADREGRLEDRPKRIKAEIFAFDSFDIDSMLSELRDRKFLVRYEANGGRFIQITNFVKHQDPHYRERASEIPAPEGVSNAIKATNVTRTQRQRIFERDDFKCRKCGATEQLSIDHITAVANGGDSTDSNLQVLCVSCNFSKRAKDRELSSNVEPTSTDVEPTLNEGSMNDGDESPRPVPLNPDSLNPDSPNPSSLIPDSLNPESGKNPLSAGADSERYPPAFEQAWLDYPKRMGHNPKRKAYRAWNARCRNGSTAEQIAAGVRRYAAYVRAAGKEGTEFVMHAASFFGPEKPFLDAWEFKSQAQRKTEGNISAAQEWLRREAEKDQRGTH